MAKEHVPFLSLTCESCHSATYVIPKNEHPSYVECPSCQAIRFTYLPMDYQEKFHNTPYISNDRGGVNLQIFGIFGKHNLPN